MKKALSLVLALILCLALAAPGFAAGQWYYDAVYWAVQNGVTNGTGKNMFGPGGICSRGHIVTFLYRDRG